LTIELRGRTIEIDDIISMGILNVTPDSFSDGGRYLNTRDAVARGLELLDEGADILDIGGESTRPGADQVPSAEELSRVIPVIEGILNERPESILSIDTTKPEVADKAMAAGCRIINDISACTSDEKMFEVASRHNAALVLMHMKGNPKNMQDDPSYADVISEVHEFLSARTEKARKFNIKNIIIDPGIGFGKRLIDNYELLDRLEEFKCLGYPILVGVSRKSLLGKSLNLGIDNRDIATVITESLAIKNGARIIRTHNVGNIILAKKLYKFISNPELVLSV
jgi:dihydropteroate synthase